MLHARSSQDPRVESYYCRFAAMLLIYRAQRVWKDCRIQILCARTEPAAHRRAKQRSRRMLSSHHTTRSGGYDFAFFRHSVVAAGFAAALFVGQALPAAAQGNRPAQQQEAPPEDSEVD